VDSAKEKAMAIASSVEKGLVAKLLKILNQPTFVAASSLLMVFGRLAAVVPVALSPKLPTLFNALPGWLASKDHAVRRGAATTLAVIARLGEEESAVGAALTSRRKEQLLLTLEACRFDKIKAVREAVVDAIEALSAVGEAVVRSEGEEGEEERRGEGHEGKGGSEGEMRERERRGEKREEGAGGEAGGSERTVEGEERESWEEEDGGEHIEIEADRARSAVRNLSFRSPSPRLSRSARTSKGVGGASPRLPSPALSPSPSPRVGRTSAPPPAPAVPQSFLDELFARLHTFEDDVLQRITALERRVTKLEAASQIRGGNAGPSTAVEEELLVEEGGGADVRDSLDTSR